MSGAGKRHFASALGLPGEHGGARHFAGSGQLRARRARRGSWPWGAVWTCVPAWPYPVTTLRETWGEEREMALFVSFTVSDYKAREGILVGRNKDHENKPLGNSALMFL